MIIIMIIEYRKQVMHNAITYSLPSDAQPVPQQRLPQPAFLTVYILSKKSHAVGYHCPLCVLSQLLVPLNPLAGGAMGEAEKALIQCKHYLASAKTTTVLATLFSF